MNENDNEKEIFLPEENKGRFQFIKWINKGMVYEEKNNEPIEGVGYDEKGIYCVKWSNKHGVFFKKYVYNIVFEIDEIKTKTKEMKYNSKKYEVYSFFLNGIKHENVSFNGMMKALKPFETNEEYGRKDAIKRIVAIQEKNKV